MTHDMEKSTAQGPQVYYDPEGKADSHSSTEAVAARSDAHGNLHRGLQARHITMIAIGGAIGTGLIIGTGKSLAQAGPGSILSLIHI